jgi:hypothetical protein
MPARGIPIRRRRGPPRYAARTPENGRVKRSSPLGDTTPCECSADLARHGPRPRRVARPRAECQRPRGAFVRAIREECLNRLILFGERRLRRASLRPGALTSGAELSGATRVGRASRPTQAEQETVLRWDREGDYVHVWSASPVTWAEARPARHPADPGDDLSGRAVSGRSYGIPISRFHWRFKRGGTQAPGRRVAARSMA